MERVTLVNATDAIKQERREMKEMEERNLLKTHRKIYDNVE